MLAGVRGPLAIVPHAWQRLMFFCTVSLYSNIDDVYGY
jgi:hypothetical protein